ncbi:MAG TPA: peptidoglycan recognition family protein [Hyphomicrobiaceae bacterium]|nr:peptidoglycan recognition family protein [Hyphomicrobiaceae bacterium]
MSLSLMMWRRHYASFDARLAQRAAFEAEASDMPPPFRPMSKQRFAAEVAGFSWQRRVWRVDVHHTFIPDHARFREIGGLGCQEGMCRHHVVERRFDDIAQHVTIAPDGVIWSGRDWNKMPASVGFGLNRGAFMLEMIGNFDVGHDRLDGAQLETTFAVVAAVQHHFKLPAEALLFHREVPVTEKTCPGTGVEKRTFLAGLSEHRARLALLTSA